MYVLCMHAFIYLNAKRYESHLQALTFNPRPVRAFLITRTVRGGGVGTTPPPGDRPLIVVELRGKDQSMRLDEISRLHILFLVLGQYLT